MKGLSLAAGQGETFVRDLLERDRSPSIEKFIALAMALGVNAADLLDGAGNPATVVGVYGYVGAGAEVSPFEIHEPLEEVEVEFPVPEGTGALVVRGDSMLPIFEDGDLVGYHREGRDPNMLIGKTCIVRVAGGRTLIKRLRKGSLPGLFTLISSNSADIEDVAIEWAAPYRFRIPRDEWRNM